MPDLNPVSSPVVQQTAPVVQVQPVSMPAPTAPTPPPLPEFNQEDATLLEILVEERALSVQQASDIKVKSAAEGKSIEEILVMQKHSPRKR